MICALHRERREQLPSERLSLYRECWEMLLGRDRGRFIRHDPGYPDLADAQKLSILQDLAYWMMRNGYADVPTRTAAWRIGAKLAPFDRPDIPADGVTQHLVERSGLIREPIEGRVDFTHRTFQEFLAAMEVVKQEGLRILGSAG